jgi:hypothetical protein
MNWFPTLLAALLGAGLLDLMAKGVRWIIGRNHASKPEVVEQAKVHAAVVEADASLIVVAKARDELADDNQRLRDQNVTERARYDRDREEWRKERAELKRDIERMETKLRQALGEVHDLKVRHGMA